MNQEKEQQQPQYLLPTEILQNILVFNFSLNRPHQAKLNISKFSVADNEFNSPVSQHFFSKSFRITGKQSKNHVHSVSRCQVVRLRVPHTVGFTPQFCRFLIPQTLEPLYCSCAVRKNSRQRSICSQWVHPPEK